MLAIEDNGLGAYAIRLAGFPAVGMADENILESGTRSLCDCYCEFFIGIPAINRGK
jgi:beta-phosphoglucomutase